MAQVGGEEQGEAVLVLGRDNKGVTNTWRHALEGLSHYREGSETALGSGGGRALARISVPVVDFFQGALSPEISFVKMDCEGAELAILQMEGADWLNVRRLVFEYSFTKERNMSVFVGIVKRLQDAGFVVMYHGLGVWDALPEWTWHTDALIYCARE